jgi:predicted CoA-binding protein
MGEKGYDWLLDIRYSEKIDIVNIFRSFVEEVVDQATRWKGPGIWM